MKKIILLLALLLIPTLAQAQSTRNPCYNSASSSNPTNQNCIPVGTLTPLPVTIPTGSGSGGTVATPSFVTQTSQYPATATPITASSTGTTGAVVATLAANATKTNYICGFTISSTATAAIAGTATVTGTISGTLSYVQGAGVSPAVVTLTQSFNYCIPSSAINTAITATSIAAGAGGVTSVVVWGYQL